MDNHTTPTAPTVSLRSLMRRPLSALRPSPSVVRAADRCAGVLRHPRSRIQVTPGWRAPSLQVPLPSGPVEVFLSHHRVSPAMWRRLTGAGADDDPPAAELHLVTTTALAPSHASGGGVRNMTADVHSLFRRILLAQDSSPSSRHDGADGVDGADAALGDGVPWYSPAACGRPTPDGERLEWTWHALTVGRPGRPATHDRAEGTAA